MLSNRFKFNFTSLFYTSIYYRYFSLRYLSIAAAAVLPAPIADITVAAPVTVSPPAYIPSNDVRPLSSATIHCFLLVSSPGVVEDINGLGLVPKDIIKIGRASCRERV